MKRATNIVSFNCNGISNSKLKKVIRSFDCHLLMLQETHIKSCDSDKVNKELKINTDKYAVIHDGKYYAKKACHGVSLLVNRKKGLEVISFKTSGHGSWIIAEVKISNCVYTVINLYAPSGDNADTAQFFEVL